MITKIAQLGQAADMLRGTLVEQRLAADHARAAGRRRGSSSPAPTPTTIDYNAYGAGQEELFRQIDYKDLAKKQGWDKHSLRVDWDKVFSEPVKAPAGHPHYGQDVHGLLIPEDWKFEHTLLLPKADSKLIDAGTVLPNLTGPFLGKAPDLGANEAGLGTAWYGPRGVGRPGGAGLRPARRVEEAAGWPRRRTTRTLACPAGKAGSVPAGGRVTEGVCDAGRRAGRRRDALGEGPPVRRRGYVRRDAGVGIPGWLLHAVVHPRAKRRPTCRAG